jgi:hypothetical protein
MKKHTTIEEQIEYGLETIESDRKIELILKDLMYVHQTIGEFIRFFHQPLHYQKVDDVKRFLGSFDKGALSALHRCYYSVLRDYIPEDIEKAFEKGERFDNPDPPYYYKDES